MNSMTMSTGFEALSWTCPTAADSCFDTWGRATSGSLKQMPMRYARTVVFSTPRHPAAGTDSTG